MGVSNDAPDLDIAYKLAEYAGKGRLKLSTGKPILPGRKQVFRVEREGRALRDIIGRWTESLQGRPLLRSVMRDGARLPEGQEVLDESRKRAQREMASLPPRLRAIEPSDPPYPVEVSEALLDYGQATAAAVRPGD
jgi:nicotinate phosphoribosyltransferase